MLEDRRHGRSPPTILLSHTNPRTHRAEQVLHGKTPYAVHYRGQPIGLRLVHTLLDDVPPKNSTTVTGHGWAVRLATRLNVLFRCEDFTVVPLVGWQSVTR